MKKITTLLLSLVFIIGVQAQESIRFLPVAIAKSNLVTVATDYEAKAILVGDYPVGQLKVAFRGRPVVLVDGVATIKFKASASSYNKYGRSLQSYKLTFTIPKPDGNGDTTFFLTQRYVVIKPQIEVYNRGNMFLYKNCGNDLCITVPAFKEDYKPVFRLTGGGKTIKGRNIGDVKIIPTGKKAKITISSGGMTIGSESFLVKDIPQPTYKIIVNDSLLTAEMLKKRIVCPRSVMIQVKPHQKFATYFPKDANYYVENYQVSLMSGDVIISTLEVIGAGKKNSSKKADLLILSQQAKEGMRLVIELKKVTRKNFQGKKEPVRLDEADKIVIIPLK